MTDAALKIKKMWNIFPIGPKSVMELRALSPKAAPHALPPQIKRFHVDSLANVETCKEEIERAALQLNRQGYNVYTVMNPIRSDFSGPGAAKDSDIRYRDLMLIDIDRVGDTSAPANQVELDAALSLARKIRAEMALRGWREPIIVMSGNGYHLYYVLENVENTPDTEVLMKRTLSCLASCFNNDIVGVDTTVHNASRITKVPGTIMRKGIATEDRPYRMAVVCDDC
jgi:hypothetical protein